MISCRQNCRKKKKKNNTGSLAFFMFEEMVSLLKQGKSPQTNLLRKRFERALVKKIGVVNTPYSLWTSDSKIRKVLLVKVMNLLLPMKAAGLLVMNLLKNYLNWPLLKNSEYNSSKKLIKFIARSLPVTAAHLHVTCFSTA